ncbi:MAG: IgGFc-binding protein [Deltaproteobacteria bacterium]|nr:IgGFc-binding protein [Deltaproteobacteria bacterium]
MVGAFMVAPSGKDGDPSMVQAVPAEQFLSQYVVLVPSTWVNDYLVLIREQGATVSIDGNPVGGGWVKIGNSKYEAARVKVSDGVHKLDGTKPFGVIVLGYDDYDSYAYPGGLNQKIINPIN